MKFAATCELAHADVGAGGLYGARRRWREEVSRPDGGLRERIGTQPYTLLLDRALGDPGLLHRIEHVAPRLLEPFLNALSSAARVEQFDLATCGAFWWPSGPQGSKSMKIG